MFAQENYIKQNTKYFVSLIILNNIIYTIVIIVLQKKKSLFIVIVPYILICNKY